MKTIYLANPYGFSKSAKRFILPKIIDKLKSIGLEVWEPFQRNNQIDFENPGWAYEVGQADVSDVKKADGIFAVLNGTPPDEGVMIELGIAIALKKRIFLFKDDFRKCTDSEDYPLNLMIFTSLPKIWWRDFYITSIEDIQRNKELLSWTKEKDRK